MKKATRCKVRGCTTYLESAKKSEPLRLIKGFCEKHYKRYYRGQIDESGKTLKKLKHTGERRHTCCKVKGCKRGPGKSGYFIRGFCSLHYSRYKAGIISASGKKLRPLKKGLYTECKIAGCNGLPDERGHFRKGFCYRHYRQYYMGHIDIDGKVINPDFKPRKG